MEIRQINEGQKGYFQAMENGVEAGRTTYSWAGDAKFIIDHTEVNPDFKGRNVGKALVTAAVEFARKKNLKIIPLCPFANSLFKKIPEWGDIVFKPSTN